MTCVVATALFLFALAVYAPSIVFGFVNWDDGKNFVENWEFRGLSGSHLRWMWTTTHMGPYQPLSWMSLALDYVVWGETPLGDLRSMGFHLTNVLLHATNVVLVYFLGCRLLDVSSSASQRKGARHINSVWGAACAAMLFGLHPLRVEVVAWITERRELLSTTFLLASVLCYLRGCAFGGNDQSSMNRRWLMASLICFALSLLSKAIGMTLPVVLLILDWYLGRLPLFWTANQSHGIVRKRRLLEKLPYVILSIPIMVLALIGQEQASAMLSWDRHPLSARLAVCCYGIVWYLRTTLVPVSLAPLYPIRLPIDPFGAEYFLSILVVCVMTFSLGFLARSYRATGAMAAWLSAIVLASPVLGLTQSGQQIAADRYSYLSCLPWALVAGGVWQKWIQSRIDARRPRPNQLPVVTLAVVVATLVTLTSYQLALWGDSEKLWQHTADVTSENATALTMLGILKADSGHPKEAGMLLTQAIKIDPNQANTHYQLGRVLASLGYVNEAAACYQTALRLAPNFPKVYLQIGQLFASQNDEKKAAECCEIALRMNPNLAEAHVEYAKLLQRHGRLDDAFDHLRTAINIRPDNVEARRLLALIDRDAGHETEALTQWREFRRRTEQPPLELEHLKRDLRTAKTTK